MKNVKVKDNIIKRWYKLAEPHKGYMFGQVFFYILYTVFLTVITIFAARTINCMYTGDWTGAFVNLGLELFTIIARKVSMHIQYSYYCKHMKHIRAVVAKKVYNKILSCKTEEVKDITKEKIANIALNNMSSMSEFPDAVASFIAYIFQVVFTLVAVFIANYIAGFVVVALGIVNFFAYYLYNKKLGRLLAVRYEQKDNIYKSYSKVIEAKSIINEMHATKKYEKEIIDSVNGNSDAHGHYYMVYSWKVHMYGIFWNIIVYMVTALMLYYVSQGTLDISIYLVIVPYLTTCTDKLNTLFDKTSFLENMRVDVDRINLILSLKDSELVKYGEHNNNAQGYNLGLIDITCTKGLSPVNSIQGADLSFKMKSINVIKGNKGGGKRIIFDLLRRQRTPDSGVILLDNLNLYQYNEKTFKNHIDYCSSHPSFIDATIKENLSLNEKIFVKIKFVCKELGILDYINELPLGFDTNISDIKSSRVLFLLGLARAILSNPKILMIYELPQDTTLSFKENIKDILLKQTKDRTIILFTHSDEFDEMANICYTINNGRVRLIKPKKS